MAVEVTLPRLGQGMESGTIVRWLKREGDRVAKGDPLYEVDTEKVTQEVEADAEGVLLKIAVPEGEVEVGRVLAYIGDAGEQVDGAAGGGTSAPAEEAAEASADVEAAVAAGEEEAAETAPPAPAEPEAAEREAAEPKAAEPEGAEQPSGRVKASPLARRIARERGIDIAQVTGTGPDGRVVAEDVERAAVPGAAPAEAAPRPPQPAPAATGEAEEQKLTSIRRTIARRLTEAWQIPVFHLTVSGDMSAVDALVRAARAGAREDEPKVTVTDVLTRICAAALLRHRAVNAHFAGESIRLFPSANVGIAVAIEAGLVVPVVRSAERLSLTEIAGRRADLVGRARAGKLTPDDLADGTFTISNLGMFGIEHFTAVINPPQAAILAVGATEERQVVRDGELRVLPMCTLTLTCDHRSIDGATGSEFLQTVRALLETPALAL